MLVRRRVTPQQYVTSTHAICTPWWRKTKWSKVPCLGNNTMGEAWTPDFQIWSLRCQPLSHISHLQSYIHSSLMGGFGPHQTPTLEENQFYKDRTTTNDQGGDWYWYFLEPPHLHIAYKKKKRQETTYFIINFITVWCLVRGC